METDLAQCLRAWRDRLGPAEVGLAGDGPRRAPGLRREEVAERAGISVKYLMRLEQGRATAPSPSVVAALARALRLDDVEAAHTALYERQIVGDLRLQLGRHPEDPGVRAIVAELRAASERFAALWQHAPAALPATSRKTFRHRTAGPITVDCDATEFLGTDLRMVVWTAAPGAADAAALASLVPPAVEFVNA